MGRRSPDGCAHLEAVDHLVALALQQLDFVLQVLDLGGDVSFEGTPIWPLHSLFLLRRRALSGARALLRVGLRSLVRMTTGDPRIRNKIPRDALLLMMTFVIRPPQEVNRHFPRKASGKKPRPSPSALNTAAIAGGTKREGPSAPPA